VLFKILNCRPFSEGFLVYFISVFLKLTHFHVCVFEEEINKQKTKKQQKTPLFGLFFFVWILTFVLYYRVIGSFHYIPHLI
jgi:hydrogenase-4 membrane subunit HyfE